MKRIVTFVFDVVFPSVDVYSDLSLIIGWIVNGHWKYAISMSMPVLLQFIFTIQKWIRLEKPESKKWSWLFLFLQCWPQWRAICAMNLDFKNDKKAEAKKKELMKEVTTTEPYLEAWPSIIIMTVIWVSASDVNATSFNNYTYHCEAYPEKNRCAVFGGFGGAPWFFITYAISIITGSFGITKFLQVGPFSVLSNEGTLGGIFKWRFLLTYLAVMFLILTKGFLIGVFINNDYMSEALGTWSGTQTLIATSALLFGLIIIPKMIFAFASIASSTGCNKKFFRIISNYSRAWVLPIATYLVIRPRKISCCSKQKCLKNELGVSKKLTSINMALTVLIYVAFISYFFVTVISGPSAFRVLITILFVPSLILSLVFNIIFLLFDEKCCRDHRSFLFGET